MFRTIIMASTLCLVTGCATTRSDSSVRSNRELPSQVDSDNSQPLSSPVRRITGRAPIYPLSLMLSGREGESAILFTVGTDGKAKDFEVESATDQRYADHAIIAVRDWLFEPAKENGVPVEVRVRQTFSYKF